MDKKGGASNRWLNIIRWMDLLRIIARVGAGLLMALVLATSVRGQNSPALLLTDTIPLDPAVRLGKLPNGLTYYIARNTSSSGKVMLQLGVKAGYVLEDKDQLELSHVLEHVAFNATTHFPSVFHYLDSLGLRRGGEVNAATGYDNTLYWIVVPTDSRQVSVRDMFVMHDFAQGMLLRPEEIDRERNVVIAEALRSSGANQRQMDTYIPTILRNSKYGEAFGSVKKRVEFLKTFNRQSLVRFYKDWYRPDLQTLIIVGDIDVGKVENDVKEIFTDLKNPNNARVRPDYEVPLLGDQKFVVVTDAEASMVEVEIHMRRRHRIRFIGLDYKSRVEEELYGTMMRGRFEKLRERQDMSLREVSHHDQVGAFPGLDILHTHIAVNAADDLKEGLQATFRELERVVQHGFTVAELEDARATYIQEMGDRSSFSFASLVSSYYEHFLHKEAAPAPEYAVALLENLLDGITVQDMNRKAAELIRNPNRDIFIQISEQHRSALPDEKTVLSWIDEVKCEKLEPFVTADADEDSLLLRRLMIVRPVLPVKRQSVKKEIGVTELALHNGARVVLKSLKSSGTENKGVKIYAIRRSGALSYSGADYLSALYAGEIVNHGGIGEFSKDDLVKIMKKESVSAYSFIYPTRTGFSGHAKEQSVNILLQLMCRYFANPIVSDEALEAWKKDKALWIKNSKGDPQTLFINAMDSIRSGGTTAGTLRADMLDSIRRDIVCRIYKERFGAVDDFVFIVVGDFEVAAMADSCNKYIGSLPAADSKAGRKIGKTEIGRCTSIQKNIYVGTDSSKASVNLVYENTFRFSAENAFSLDALALLMQNILTQRLREVEGGTYYVYVRSIYSRTPSEKYSVNISFECLPTIVDRMVSATRQEVDRIVKNGVSDAALLNVKTIGMGNASRMAGNADSWMTYLIAQYAAGSDPSEITQNTVRWENISGSALKRSMDKFIKNACFSRFILMPTK